MQDAEDDKLVFDVFEVTSGDSRSEPFFVEREEGVMEPFQVQIPWSEAIEAAIKSQSLSDSAKESIKEQLAEHSDKITESIAAKVSEQSEITDSLLWDVLRFYFDNKDAIDWLVEWVKIIISR